MKQATVRELRNNYAEVLRWVARGEEVTVTRRGKVVARVLPPHPSTSPCEWVGSAAFTRPAWSRTLQAEESAKIMAEAKGGS